MGDTARELPKGLEFLRTDELVLELFARGDVHERTDELRRAAEDVANNVGPLEDVEIRAIEMPQTVFSRPMIETAGERFMDRDAGASAILGVQMFLPESDIVGRRGRGKAKKRF